MHFLQKPSNGVLDRNDPLSAGLVAFFPFFERGGSGVRDLVANDLAVPYAGVTTNWYNGGKTFLNAENRTPASIRHKMVSFSMSAIVRPTNVAYNSYTIAARGRTDGTDNDTNAVLRLGLGPYVEFYWRGLDWNIYTSSNPEVTANQWWHLLIRATPGTPSGSKVYVNGVHKAGGYTYGLGNEAVRAEAIGSNTLSIGAIQSAAEGFVGQIYSVKMWNRALSHSEAQDEYANPWRQVQTLSARRYFFGKRQILGADASGGTPVNLAGSDAGTSTDVGALSVGFSMAGTSAGTSTDTGALTLGVTLAGSDAGTSSDAGALTLGVSLAGTDAGTSTDTATLTVGGSLAGSSDGTSTDTAALSVGLPLAGSDAGTSTDAGALSVGVALVGSDAGTSTDTATLTFGGDFAGTSAGTSTDSAALSVGLPLSGSDAGTSSDVGALTLGVALAGSDSGTSTDAGALESFLSLSGSSVGSSSDAGLMVLGVGLSALEAGTSADVGNLTANSNIPFPGSTHGAVTATNTGAISATNTGKSSASNYV